MDGTEPQHCHLFCGGLEPVEVLAMPMLDAKSHLYDRAIRDLVGVRRFYQVTLMVEWQGPSCHVILQCIKVECKVIRNWPVFRFFVRLWSIFYCFSVRRVRNDIFLSGGFLQYGGNAHE